jgi:hypothetical protein
VNKAIEIINQWIEEKTKHLDILRGRRERELHWSIKGDEKQRIYYKPKYEATKAQFDQLKIELAECHQALKELLPK